LAGEGLTPRERRRFDELLEEVLRELPQWVLDLLDEVPLIVEDYPADDVLRETETEDRDELCGLHSGIPLTEPEHRHGSRLPDQILIYREGILSAAADEEGRIGRKALRREIRITVLHEIGHHYGLEEEDLSELGYD
jgi:predicted Zn-dependent protease with MMP-like domain